MSGIDIRVTIETLIGLIWERGREGLAALPKSFLRGRDLVP